MAAVYLPGPGARHGRAYEETSNRHGLALCSGRPTRTVYCELHKTLYVYGY